MEISKLVFESGSEVNEYVPTADDSCDIADASVENEKVATVEIDSPTCVIISAVGVGKTVVHLTGEDGSTFDLPVEVKTSLYSGMLKSETWLFGTYYRTKAIEVKSCPGATGTLKVGSKTYKVKVGKSGFQKIKLKKPAKMKTKVALNVKWRGVKTTVKSKIISETYVDSASASKKTITLNVYCLLKGDIVKIKYGGKTYTKKVKKNRPDTTTTLKFKVKKKVPKNAKFKVIVTTNKKVNLDKSTIKLNNGSYYTW